MPVEAGWAGFPEALPIIVAAAHQGGPGPWGPHLFFGEDGALIGNGGWKGPRWTAQPNWAMPSRRRAKAGASPPPSCVELVRRARVAGLHMVVAHTLAAESASTSVLARCGFARVAELTDPDEGPVWRLELRLDENAAQRP